MITFTIITEKLRVGSSANWAHIFLLFLSSDWPCKRSKKQRVKNDSCFGSVRVPLSALYGTVRSMQKELAVIDSRLFLSLPAYLLCRHWNSSTIQRKTVQLYSSENVSDAFCFLFSISCRTMAFQKRSVKPVSYTFSSLDSLFLFLFCWHAVITSLNTSTHMWQWKVMEGWWRNQRMKRSGEKKEII